MTLCDAHIHVVGATPEGMIPERSYTPGPAAIGTLQRLAAPHGITRFVVVQPSFYGTDNSLVVDALHRLGGNGRGVAVLDPASPGDLAPLDAAGVRGLRLNLYSTHGVAPRQDLATRFAATCALAAPRGWHVQVLAHLPMLLEHADMLAAAPCPVVLDHYGLPDAAPDSPSGRRLLALVARPHLWVKLSAPYRMGAELAVAPDPAWLAALLATAPGRCVWGSDWPHTPAHEAQPGAAGATPYRPLDYAAIVAAFRAAAGPLADQVMGANPATLYGWPA